jgi:tetratricopeptide (TPR) repeat protein
MARQANQSELEIFAARAEREPANAKVQFELGLRLERAGKFREAIQAFQAARSDVRRAATVQLHLGECFQRINQLKLAMASYEAAIEACDDTNEDANKLALYQAGLLAMEAKDVEKAEKHLTQLAAIDFAYRDVAERLDKLAALRETM